MKFIKGFLNKNSGPTVKSAEPLVKKINTLEGDLSGLMTENLKAQTHKFKKRLSQGENPDGLVAEAFALVREAAKRTLGLRHFDVQLIGGIALHQGSVAEMKTGEGKTLVATLPAYLNALEGKGVHVVTVNDYLARRDAVWMGQVYHLLGLSVGCINHEESFLYDPSHKSTDSDNSDDELDKERDTLGSFKVVHEFLKPCSRKEAYQADITYGTNNEFGFDYLRDNLEYDFSKVRQRDFHYAIVDEVDSILIDEARTPLIISAPSSEAEDLYRVFSKVATQMKQGEDYEIDEKLKAITLTDAGVDKAERLLNVKNIYTEQGTKLVHHLENSVKAKALFKKDTDYVVKGGEVVIVDAFTGRLQPGRRWSGGLHQAIEAKEGLNIQQESRTFASITFQNFFRMYKKLSGMTGTALTSEEEFRRVYGLDSVAIPTNKPNVRIDHNDLILQTERGKYQAIVKRVKTLNEKSQPVLIGTVSIEHNEVLSGYLSKAGIKHEVLNAKNHEREGEIIAQAGKKGAVTIATNVAGRGVDIKLGGNPATPEEYEEVKGSGGLFVLGTERHEARRIDNQLRGRSARQGDPGETQFFVSLEDSLMRVFASDTIKKLMGKFGISEDEPIENKMITRSLETAQTKIEGFNFDARKHVLEYDDVLNFQRSIIYNTRREALASNREAIEQFMAEIVEEIPEAKEVIEEKKKKVGEENFFNVLRTIILQSFDLLWVEHLEAMDYLRGSVNLRAYGQRDPLVEYKKEGLRLFKEMQEILKKQIFQVISGIDVASASSLTTTTEATTKPSSKAPEFQKVGRNDPCPCGSGKKYKKCHGV
jgi:preprotein translocase subunit SecA